MLASFLNVAHTVGYPVLFVLVMAESGGAPVPGETSLITGAVLASQGKLDLLLVIGIAACAAIVGDNLGYWIGRKGGRWILQRPGAFQSHRLRVLKVGEPFFARHGPKAVFFGRFVLGLRVWASWLAGATCMPWRSFLFWNAAGGIIWATVIGVIAYELGRAAENVTEAFGIYGLVAFVLAATGLFIAHYRHRRNADVARGAREHEERPVEAAVAYAGNGEESARGRFAPITKESRPAGRLRCDDDRSDMERFGSTSR